MEHRTSFHDQNSNFYKSQLPIIFRMSPSDLTRSLDVFFLINLPNKLRKV